MPQSAAAITLTHMVHPHTSLLHEFANDLEALQSTVPPFGWLARQPRAAAYATFVTGPSRTADIERSLTIGVQGPSRLTAAIVREGSP